MGLRDRFFTPTTAKAIMSWRTAVGIAVAVAVGFAGVPIWLAIGLGVGVIAGLVLAAMPASRGRPAVDPFVLSEPWRRLMQDAQTSGRKIRRLVDGMNEGPLRDTLHEIGDQLDRGLDEAWEVARRGDEIDEMVRELDRPRLRDRLAALEADGSAAGDSSTAVVESLTKQLATADRLAEQSARAADELRRIQVQLDELVARVAEVRSDGADTDAYAARVHDLVIKLEALRQAIEETRTA